MVRSTGREVSPTMNIEHDRKQRIWRTLPLFLLLISLALTGCATFLLTDEINPIVPVVGFIFSMLLFSATHLQLQRHHKLQRSVTALHKAQADLEGRVAQRTAELETSNNELKAFAYSVSHDLRAPLRGIDGFSKFLMLDYSDVLDETGRDYLQRIRNGATRMGDIIDDLLTLSRVTRWELSIEEVNLSDLAIEILARLREEDPERKAQLTIEPGVTAHADRRLVTIALENVLGNAWKFTSREELAEISFSARAMKNEDGSDVTLFVVEDNGAGFDASYAEDLFESFRRLHAPTEFSGTGIGLATVKRVITRHGGTITAEGEPGRGARFSFTLG